MNKRSVAAVAAILSDPDNSQRTAEEVAEQVITALDEVRARSHRVAVVGQITFRPQGDVHTVVLGPFSARGVLDDPDKFRRATAGGTAARQAGQMLAWDPSTPTSRGRFLLAPAFATPRDAWDFYRADYRGAELKQLTTKMLLEGDWRNAKGAAELAQDLADWRPGLWEARVAAAGEAGPACICGLKNAGTCPRHGGGTA